MFFTRAEEYTPERVLEKIEDTNIRAMVGGMLSKDPASRMAASEYLSQQRGVAFPEYFYSFLQSYMR